MNVIIKENVIKDNASVLVVFQVQIVLSDNVLMNVQDMENVQDPLIINVNVQKDFKELIVDKLFVQLNVMIINIVILNLVIQNVNVNLVGQD